MKNILLAIIARLSKKEKEKRPVIRRWVRHDDIAVPDEPPPDLGEKFVVHHLRNVEPADAWLID